MSALGVIGIFLGIAVLIIGSIRGYSTFVSGIAASIIICLFNAISLREGILTNYVGGMTGFITGNFAVFAAGALMGKAYEITHGAKAVARLLIKVFGEKFAPYALFFAIVIMTWGGITGFVLAFSLFPIALEVYREADLPRGIIPGVIIAGCCTASSWGPGTAQPVNAAMANGFGVSLMAAAVPSFIMVVVVLIASCVAQSFFFKQAKAKGMHFEVYDTDPKASSENLPNGIVALIPIIVALLLINIKVNGATILPTAFGVFVGAVLAFLLMYKYKTDDTPVMKHVSEGFTNALLSAGGAGAVAAVGAVAQNTEAFQSVLGAVTGIGGGPLVGAGLAGLIVAAITGGATAMVGLLAPLLTPIYTQMGANLEMVGRIVMTAGHVTGTLPNGGFVNTVVNGIAKDTYKNCFKYVFFICSFANLIALIVGIIIMTMMGAYV